MSEASRLKYTLGLDLGSASCGWAIVELDSTDDPVRLADAGVRIFDAGVVGGEVQIREGKDKSKATERRLARQTRRQTHRRALRQRKLFHLLQEHGLLPANHGLEVGRKSSEQRHEILNALDKRLIAAWRGKATIPGSTMDMADQSLVYLLRAAAVKEKIGPEALGRILYHLTQRRGYWSNRLEVAEAEADSVKNDAPDVAPAKKTKRKAKEEASDDDLGQVAKGISTLRAEMEAAGTRYLGSYFAMLNPHDKGLVNGSRKGIRHRWTERSMFVEEFAAIWETQKKFYPEILTEAFEAKVRYWLFFQRPLASANHLIGFCELEKSERRAPWATLEAQRFRLLQKVNDLRLIESGKEVSLQADERTMVLDYLETKGDLTFSGLKKLLGRPSIEGFNLERGLKDKIEGNRVNVAMLEVFGDQWNAFSVQEKHTAVEQWRTIGTPERAELIAKEKWKLDDRSAKKWAQGTNPPKDYCRLSRKALAKVLPLMEKGVAFKTVERAVYGPRHSGADPMKLVPKVAEYLPSINNPAVLRALTEMRKVVNAVIREYGPPYQIRIELARELRKNRKEREKQTFDAKERQEKRETAARQILAKQSKANPSTQEIRDVPQYMIDKWLLAEECHWCCPYTGNQINYDKLFVRPEFEVEHIIPLSRCTDNSFGNKTLCHRDENQKKGGNTPWIAYHADEDRWAQILTRVSKFANGPRIGEHPKLRRFKLRTEEEVEGFTKRQLTDTRYTSKLSARLLMSLYGGRDTVANADDDTAEFYDKTGRRIFASTGGVTHLLRDAWMLHPNVVLGLPDDGQKRKGKNRSDHRHHAVDALVIALTTEKQVREINLHAKTKQGQKWPLDYRDLVRGLQTPWLNRDRFLGDVLKRMLVSHKPEHKLGGSLHIDTLYPQPKRDPEDGTEYVCLRRSIVGIKDTQVKLIQDDSIRKAVERKLLEHGGNSKKFNPDDMNTLPCLTARDGRSIPIKKVRIREARKSESLTKFPGNRLVESNSIHHFEIFVRRDKKDREQWTHIPISIIEAHRRQSLKIPVISMTHPDDHTAEFVFSLMKGDAVEFDTKLGRQVCRVKKFFSAGPIWFTYNNDAQKDDEKSSWNISPNPFRLLNPTKVIVDPLGRKYEIKKPT